MGATSGKCLPSRASEHFERAGGQGRVMRPGEYANGINKSLGQRYQSWKPFESHNSMMQSNKSDSLPMEYSRIL